MSPERQAHRGQHSCVGRPTRTWLGWRKKLSDKKLDAGMIEPEHAIGQKPDGNRLAVAAGVMDDQALVGVDDQVVRMLGTRK
jgi:hypothetical protein